MGENTRLFAFVFGFVASAICLIYLAFRFGWIVFEVLAYNVDYFVVMLLGVGLIMLAYGLGYFESFRLDHSTE